MRRYAAQERRESTRLASLGPRPTLCSGKAHGRDAEDCVPYKEYYACDAYAGRLVAVPFLYLSMTSALWRFTSINFVCRIF
jgi:hypothetical protein